MEEFTYKKIFYFWLPLLATWLMMSVEGPYIASIIARINEPKLNLAAYGIAFAFGLIVEAPIIMLMSATTALVRDKFTLQRLRNFTRTLNFLITLFFLFCMLPPVFSFVTNNLLELPEKISELTYSTTFLLLPWPAAIGYRRFYQGVLIKSGLTKRVAVGTVFRLVMMSSTAFLLYKFSNLNGAETGALALSVGVVSEAIVTKLMAQKAIKLFLEIELPNHNLSYKKITNFYFPLAITSVIALAVQPMVTFFMGQSRFPIESLAVLPVINSFIFIFKAVGLSYQEVIIALMDKESEKYNKLRNIAYVLGGIVFLGIGIIAFTFLAEVWFKDVSGLSDELTNFASLPLKILILIPALTVLISFERGILVKSGNTKPITVGSILEVAGILITLFALIHLCDFIGAIAAACSFIVGRLIAVSYLFPNFLKAVKVNEFE